MAAQPMDHFRYLRDRVIAILEALAGEGAVPSGLETARVAVEPPREAGHGDVATNAAMVLSKAAGMKPRDLADLIVAKLQELDEVTSAEAAGPGFINMRLADGFWLNRLKDILAAGVAYGDSDLGQGKKVNVEYVSANPTGPMHVGHGRGAVVGDALARLLAKAGYDV